jgi:hypothetical protein
VLIEYLPRESCTARAVHGPVTEWGDTEHLLANVLDVLNAANWQRGGGKGARPRRLPRPGIEEEDAPKIRRAERAMPLEEARTFFTAWRTGAYEEAEVN